MARRLELPALGQTMEEGTIIRWLKAEGDLVEKGDPLYEVMTDKVNMEVETPVSGVLRKILAPVDAVIPVNGGVAIIGTQDESIADLLDGGLEVYAGGNFTNGITAANVQAGTAPPAQPAQPTALMTSETRIFASPRARRVADEYGIDLEHAGIAGTGHLGRITEADVAAAYEAQRKAKLISPLAQRVAAEHGVALNDLAGTGHGGKIVHDDVRRALPNDARVLPTDPSALTNPTLSANGLAPSGPAHDQDTVITLNGMRKMVADTVARSASTIPHVTLTIPVDMSEAMRFRKQVLPAIEKSHGVRVTVTDIIAKATARALRDHPLLNSTFANNQITLHKSVNIGIAVSLGAEGLIVPVVRDVAAMSLGDFSAALKALAARAKWGTLGLDEVAQGTFSITNLGTYGVTQFNPIINPPQAAILGVCAIVETVVPIDGQPQIRSMMNLCLSFDHRVADGAPAAAFLAQLKEILEQPYLIFA